MKSDIIAICGDLSGQKEAMQEAERFTEYLRLTGKNAMHIRLLTEKAISLVHGIIHDFKGDFWLESEQTEQGLLCKICVAVNTDFTDSKGASSQRKCTLAASIVAQNSRHVKWFFLVFSLFTAQAKADGFKGGASHGV